MRKHFLVLMLMALLPLAGFAADLSKGMIVAPSPYFGVAPSAVSVYNEANSPLTLGTDYTFDGYFSDAACTSSVTAAQIKAANAGTTYYVKVTGINGYENSLIGSFEVKPMVLTVTVANASKTYLANDPASFTVSSVTIDGGAAAPTAVKNAVQAGRKAGENAGSYEYTATLTNQPNYTIATVNGTFTINPKGFVENTDVIVTVTANFTYTGAAQEATVEVKDKAKNTVLTKGTDYTVAYSNHTNAGTNTAVATITGKGNYATTNIVKNYSIAAAPLLVTPTATKVYDGTNTVTPVPATYNETNAKFAFQGFVDNQTAANVAYAQANVTWAVTSPSANKGTYELKITGNDFTLANYTFIPVAGTFEITQLPITFKAADKTIDFGDAETYALTDAWKATAIDADEDNLVKAIKITRASSPLTSGANKGNYELTPAFKTDAEIDAEVDADNVNYNTAAKKTAAKAAIKTARDNYNGTFAKGYATINAAPLQIALKESAYTLEKVYDGQPVSITLDKENGLTILGKKSEDDVVNLDNLTLTVVDNAAAVGTYQLKLEGATADNYNITFIPSQYKINPRTLNITVYDQVFVKGTAPVLNTTLYEIEDDPDDDDDALASTDKASDVFKLTHNVTLTSGKVDDAATDGTITAEASNADPTKTKWANYAVTVTNGTAKVIDATALVLDDTKNLTSSPLNANHDGATVSFTARNLNAEQWNMLVLPFDITVKNLSTAFGYAVVDVLDENATDGNAHFRIQASGTIKANTPFLIYPSDDKQNLNQVVFTGVNVKRTTNNVSVSDQGGVKFWGTYKATSIFGEKYWYMSKGSWYDASKYTEASPVNLKALRCYLDFTGSSAAAPSIFIEEPNGSMTAINAISGEAKTLKTEGSWYTINGMKINGVPTQKGIYIKNGKKVVIK